MDNALDMNRRRLILGAPHRATASGSSVTINATEPKIERLAVTFAPVQSGSGTPSPSNVRPVSGWSEIPVQICPGINDILSAVPEGKYGTIDLSTGVMTVTHGTYRITNDTVINSNAAGNFTYVNMATIMPMKHSTVAPHPSGVCDMFPVVASRAQTYTSTGFGAYDSGTYYHCIYIWDIAKTYPSITTGTAAIAKIKELSPTFVYELETPQTIQLAGISSGSGTVTVMPFQLNGGTPSPTNQRPIIQVLDGPSAPLNGTYYGGTVDLVSGTMVVTYGMYTVNSDTVIGGTTLGFSYINMTNIMPMKHSSTAPHPNGFCDMFPFADSRPPAAQRTHTTTCFGIYDSGRYYNYLYIWDINKDFPSVTTRSEETAKIKELAPTFVYELETPQTIQLTPQTITALRGLQTVSSPAGSADITYWTK